MYLKNVSSVDLHKKEKDTYKGIPINVFYFHLKLYCGFFHIYNQIMCYNNSLMFFHIMVELLQVKKRYMKFDF